MTPQLVTNFCLNLFVVFVTKEIIICNPKNKILSKWYSSVDRVEKVANIEHCKCMFQSQWEMSTVCKILRSRRRIFSPNIYVYFGLHVYKLTLVNLPSMDHHYLNKPTKTNIHVRSGLGVARMGFFFFIIPISFRSYHLHQVIKEIVITGLLNGLTDGSRYVV